MKPANENGSFVLAELQGGGEGEVGWFFAQYSCLLFVRHKA